MNSLTMEALENLWNVCQEFIESHNITCEESIYQVDNNIIDSPNLVYSVCKIVGFVKFDEEEE